MPQKILNKRGLKNNLPILDTGELGLCTDTKELFIGVTGVNEKLINKRDLDATLIESFKERGFYLNEYGFKTSNTALENTTIFHNVVALMQEGDKLIIPKGTYNINNTVFNPPNNCSLICYGKLVSVASGVVFKIGNPNTASMGIKVEGLRVEQPTPDWSKMSTGIQVVNQYDGKFNLQRVFGFFKNIEVIGTNTHGVSYNRFNIGRSDGGKKSIFLTSNTGGWCNENVFIGGEYSFVSSNGVLDDSCVLITIDRNPTSDLNNNHFIAPSLEGNPSKKGLACLIEGTFNTIEKARMEWIGNVVLTSNSQYNEIDIAYDDYTVERIVDNGQGNIIGTRRKRRMNSSFDEVFTVQNQGSGAHKNLLSKDTGGATRWFVTADGVVFSAQRGYYQNGIRFMTTDGTFNDRGIFTGGGSPEGVIPAQPGSLYLNVNGGANVTLYVKQSGSGSTGWVAK